MKQAVSISICALAASACASGPKPMSVPVPEQSEIWVETAVDRSVAEQASLWTNGPGSLLSMRRAKEVGDLLTVVVQMDDRASVQNSLSESRSADRELSIDALFGLPSVADTVLPAGASLSPAIDYNRQYSKSGSGALSRSETIAFTLAARVVDLENNGNLVIEGFQRTEVSNRVRYLQVSGVIRAQDVTRTNTVSYDKIAEANLSYVSSRQAAGADGRGGPTSRLGKLNPFRNASR
ncbi:MAG: flagellar basal body L-ring protein FlgH [Pseudomonadota bacterium]